MVIRYSDGNLALQSTELKGELGKPEEAIKRLCLMGVSERAARQIIYEAMMTGTADLRLAVSL